jgi:hypothetical protein
MNILSLFFYNIRRNKIDQNLIIWQGAKKKKNNFIWKTFSGALQTSWLHFGFTFHSRTRSEWTTFMTAPPFYFPIFLGMLSSTLLYRALDRSSNSPHRSKGRHHTHKKRKSKRGKKKVDERSARRLSGGTFTADWSRPSSFSASLDMYIYILPSGREI